ncbi:hypothetical protein B4N89_32155 [Embleya scabrispora]|uniref:Uncharacterized protein n=1 Tax=Embleya scabrispora TaxID=159449 RepID=A0A1T3NQ14_9ACTN|nr:hypothetical protein [Embleya scabrispora]OPC78800.1 hypothetical protein B4N89_32155 [Embleya scabrispora]
MSARTIGADPGRFLPIVVSGAVYFPLARVRVRAGRANSAAAPVGRGANPVGRPLRQVAHGLVCQFVPLPRDPPGSRRGTA